jgi:hypothetical protein
MGRDRKSSTGDASTICAGSIPAAGTRLAPYTRGKAKVAAWLWRHQWKKSAAVCHRSGMRRVIFKNSAIPERRAY